MGSVDSGRIVVGMDGSAHATAALAWAVSSAGRSGAVVEPVAVWRSGPPWPWRRTTGAQVEAAAAVDPAVVVRYTERTGPAGPALVRAAEHADLLVLGRHTGDTDSAGAVVGHCARYAACPVVVVAEVVPSPVGPLVVGVDGSPLSLAALDWALAEADRRGAEVHVVTTRPAGQDTVDLTDAVAERCAEHPGVPVRRERHTGSPGVDLVSAAQTADLLVVGSHGAGGLLSALLGSVSDYCLRNASCPVAVIPAAMADEGALRRLPTL
ncbi:universal stress protein [Actinokineospora terrae]|uniref:Nucleotide-binding universal stress protein, UspA family n=1 Tax=Actinokineospora terrae TaxID=155974 RepID=A0A1H9X2C2_9PSEU|nr:universal stress protein [Actinokineospora terrae]SES40181.1 Nucleotide-binding universal stress protein, UspA family [Actinokineospora terrae]